MTLSALPNLKQQPKRKKLVSGRLATRTVGMASFGLITASIGGTLLDEVAIRLRSLRISSFRSACGQMQVLRVYAGIRRDPLLAPPRLMRTSTNGSNFEGYPLSEPVEHPPSLSPCRGLACPGRCVVLEGGKLGGRAMICPLCGAVLEQGFCRHPHRRPVNLAAEKWFEAYAKRSGTTVDWLRNHHIDVYPCDCGQEGCQGFAALSSHLESP